MTKEQFLTRLEIALQKLPREEKREMLRDLEEHFAIGLEEGKEETEIAAALGSPDQIAQEAIATYRLSEVETNGTAGNFFRALWAVIGLSFFNLIIVLGPFIGLIGILFGGWVASMAFVASPLLVLVNYIVFPSSFELLDLFLAIGLSGLGIFIALAMYALTKGVISGFMWYLRFNVNFVKGGQQT